MKRTYRIIDEVDTKTDFNDFTRIIIESRNTFDRIFCFGWRYEKSILYNNDKSKFPFKDKNDAICEAEKFIEEVKNGTRGVTQTVVKVI